MDAASIILFAAYPDAFRAVLLFGEPESLEVDGGLNLRSALTHVMADTYRTFAVIIAASVSMADGSVNSTAADAWGAIFVELPVFAMCVSICRAAWLRYTARATGVELSLEATGLGDKNGSLVADVA